MVAHPFRWVLEPVNNWRRRGQETERSGNIQSHEIQREVGKSMMTFEYQHPELPEIKLIPELPCSLSQ